MIVLMYHDVISSMVPKSGFENDTAYQYKISSAQFEEQVRALLNYNVEYTFDDGGVSFLLEAAPILEKYGKRGIFFIASDYIDTPGFLTSSQVKELYSRGHIIGSHSKTHPHDMSKLTSNDVNVEWGESVLKLSEIVGDKICVASIPNGDSSSVVLDSAVACGITTLYTSVPRDSVSTYKNINLVGRYVVHRDTKLQDVLKIVTSYRYRRKLYFRRQCLVFLHKLLGRHYNTIKSLILRKK